jgi:RNA methyltransferase, TrmH family
MPISHRQKKLITSLQVKKYRKQEQCFLVEGAKSVLELLASDFEVVLIAGTPEFLDQQQVKKGEVIPVSEAELAGLGEFQSNNTVLAVARMKPNTPLVAKADEFVLVLDDIRDPGNLGTIIRTADWFGIDKIVASEETADHYNAKVITSTMGSFTRTHLYYTNLENYLREAGGRVFGAYLNGTSIHNVDFGAGGFVLIGNESRGISPELMPLVTDRVTIPRYGKAESLNAAIATAIFCDNLKR